MNNSEVLGLVFDLPETAWMAEVRRLRLAYDPAREHFPIEITVAGSSGLGWFSPGQSPDVIASHVRAIAQCALPFSCRFSSVEAFPHSRVYYLALEDEKPFISFQRTLAGTSLKFEATEFSYKPHCTIAALSAEAPASAHAELAGFPIPVSPTTISSLSLYAVNLSTNACRHVSRMHVAPSSSLNTDFPRGGQRSRSGPPVSSIPLAGNTPMEIRPAVPTDSMAIAQIHVSGWRFAYRELVPQAHLDGLSVVNREKNWANSITTGQPHILVAVSAGSAIGWVAFDRCRDPDKAKGAGEIWAIYVAPEHLGHGVGRELWLNALAGLRANGYREVTLWVLSQNERACQFYAKAGFTPDVASEKTVEIGGAKLQELRYVRSIAA